MSGPAEDIRLCSGCRGEGILATPDGEDAFECTVCDGTGLAQYVPFYVPPAGRAAAELEWQGTYPRPSGPAGWVG